MKSPGTLLLALAAVGLLALAACARGPELDHRPITLDFDETPAADLIQICADQGGFPVEYQGEAAEVAATRTVTLHVRGMPWDEALGEVLAKASLQSRWVRRGDDWILVVSAAPP